MLHCQQCGAANSSDARFCNQCGAQIARPGEPGGPLSESDPAAGQETTLHGHADPDVELGVDPPPPRTSAEPEAPSFSGTDRRPSNLDVSTVSLSAIGVRSRGTAWGIFVGTALALVALGALGMWIVQRTSEGSAPVAEASEPEEPEALPPEEEVEIGDALPEGSAAPEGDIVTGSPRPTKTSRASTGTPTPRSSGTSSTPRASAGTTAGRTPSSGTTTAGRTGGTSTGGTGGTSTGGTGGTSTGGTGGTNRGSTNTGTTGGSPTTGAGGTSTSTGGSEPDWDSMESERDREMDAYGARVRSVVRQYYAPRAQSCFEHETRNRESVRGTVVIGFTVRANGEIENARVERNTTGIDTLGACLARQVNSWRLPPPPEAPLAMQMPFSR